MKYCWYTPAAAGRPVAVVGVEEQRQVVEDVRLVKVDALPHQGFVHTLQIEQVQLVHAAFVAGDVQVVQHGGGLPLGEGHGKAHTGGVQPALGGEPGVRPLLLLVLLEHLAEQAKVVQQAHAVPGRPKVAAESR